MFVSCPTIVPRPSRPRLGPQMTRRMSRSRCPGRRSGWASPSWCTSPSRRQGRSSSSFRACGCRTSELNSSASSRSDTRSATGVDPHTARECRSARRLNSTMVYRAKQVSRSSARLSRFYLSMAALILLVLLSTFISSFFAAAIFVGDTSHLVTYDDINHWTTHVVDPKFSWSHSNTSMFSDVLGAWASFTFNGGCLLRDFPKSGGAHF